MRRVKRGEAEQTIVDLTDNRKLIVMVSTSKARQIIYNPNNGTYNPDFSKEPMVLTPELYITGSSTNVIATAETVKWYVRPNTLGQRIPIVNNDTYSIGNDFKLTISKNIMKDMLTMEFILEVIYKEPDSDFRTTIPHHMELVNISMGEDGRNGIDGLNGLDGERGLPGPKGESSYTHLAYANNATGTQDFSLSDSNRSYIGMYVDSLPSDSTNPSDYKWTKVEGMPGDKGIQGPKGADGRTPYFHVAYANNETGTNGFSTSDSTNKLYIGQYTDYIENDSTKPTDYAWTKIKGESGEQGPRGLQGLQGSKGDQGLQGPKGLDSYTHIAYATNETGTSGFSTTTSVGKTYIGMYVDSLPSDSTNPTDYKWTKIKGENGEDGDQGIPGKPGADGKTPYFHIAYANNDTGTLNFSTTDSNNKLYIGQYTDYVSADSTKPTDYSWSKIKGEDGKDSATLAIITPDGTTSRDTTSSLRLDSKFFIGGKEVTANSYKWYYSNGSSTVTHSTGKSTSIGATLIKNSLPIFLDATYKGITYTASVTLNDISDVYTSIILGVATFKNGKGSNTYTAKVYRNGEEIDPGGSIYSYEWEKLNSQGVKDTKFTKTGKTIIINASEIDNTNLFNCYIYTK